MALTFDLAAVIAREGADYVTSPTDDDRLAGTTDALIWATMIVGISRITEQNAAEFFARVAAYEGAHRLRRFGPAVTFEDVWRHRGLATNASRMTPAAWGKRIASIWKEKADDERRRYFDQKADAARDADLAAQAGAAAARSRAGA